MRRILLAIAVLHLFGWGLLIGMNAASLTITTGIIAYALGLRHAFDADHLAAIHATTHKLHHEHKNSEGVGFFFSLGHSTIVFSATALAVAGAKGFAEQLLDPASPLKQTSSFIGSIISASFLILLAIYNMNILRKIILNQPATLSGFISKLSKPASSAARMFPIGMLFGLGFDTATSVAMLSLSIISVASGQLIFAALALPIIFTSGMALGDTLSGYLMSQSNRQAQASKRRRIFEIALTSIAITSSLTIAIIELVNL